ncbi:MAG TPA: valine--tRNA ligase [Myxococcota bacterium]|nr:valine--tRNA ligase [Myxococcota bacterium]HQK52084.1 valine--tRNA ligase [Myxococcota bacterium]
MDPLSKGYSHREVEAGWYPRWREAGYFRAQDQSDREPFCIVIPPPNVTGHLHMGHALTFTIQDILTRWKRMEGFNALWLPGTDHAGIATQMVVERELQRRGVSRHDLGREAFLEEVWRWKEAAHARITEQMCALGVSVDWDRERFTLDEGLSRAVRHVFVQLYREGLIYRDQRMVNWSPGIQTVLSDLEVEEREVRGHLWYIAYPLEDGSDRLVVATTRPETLFGDTAVAVHPEDPRHAAWIGRKVRLPLADRLIPVIGDAEAVDLSFGTGALKITPAHDFADFETGRRHGLPMIQVLDAHARMNDAVPERYRGLSREEARKRVVEDLEAQGLLVKVEDYTHRVGHCQRSGVVVEPTVSLQWYVRTKPLAEEAIRAVRDRRTVFIPAHWEKTYMNWMENIRDWCISRQLWWGHQIPVWYCTRPGCDGMVVDTEDPGPDTRCPACGGTSLRQDEDVLDTWFSSALWPFSTLGWPDQTPALKTFYPTSVMETGFDIIFFWVARMMMMGLHFMGDVPFRVVYLHAMVRDEKGLKMSKTKGNVIDPLEVVEEVGADALRFTLAQMTAQGRDIKLSMDRLRGYREFVNKVWNASRFVLMNLEDAPTPLPDPREVDRTAADTWVLTRLAEALEGARDALEGFRFNEAASGLYQFTWHRFCDWYLELAKGALAEGGDRRRAAQAVLVASLERILRALHPFMPYVTEELWQRLRPWLRGAPDSVMIAAYPRGDDLPRDPEVAGEMDEVIGVIGDIRAVRSEVRLSPSERPEVVIRPFSERIEAHLQAHRGDIERLAGTGPLVISREVARPEGTAVKVGDTADCYVQVGRDRLQAEIARQEKELARVDRDLEAVRRKLGNPDFLARAREEVVEAEREKEAQFQETRERLVGALALLKS